MNKFFRQNRIPKKMEEAQRYLNKISYEKTGLLTDRLKVYIEKMVPKMEEKIEINILNKLYHNTTNPIFKEQILKSYERRKYDKHFLSQRNVYDLEKIKIDIKQENIDFYPISFNDYKDCNYNDIGKFFDFPLEEFSKLFPSMNFGFKDFYETNLSQSLKFAFMLRKECFQLIQILKRKIKLEKLTLSDLNIPQKLQNVKDKETLDYVYSDINIFFKIYYTISCELSNALQKYKYNETLHTVISNSFAFDQIILFLTWQMDNKNIRDVIFDTNKRKYYIEQFIDQLVKNPMMKHLSPGSQLIAETFYHFNFANQKINLIEQQEYFEKIPSKLKPFLIDGFLGFDSGILFYGTQGAGKSMALYQMLMFARTNNWFIAKIPSVKQITQNLWEVMKLHEESRLYVNPTLSVKILEDLYSSNKDNFKEFKVNLDIYGKYNQVGVHDDEPNPARNFYIKNRRRHLDDYDQENPKEENLTEEYKEEIQQQQRRLSNELQEPQTISQIAEFGLKHERLATNAIAEILEQIYNQEDKYVMVLVDDYNWMFRASSQISLRYSDLKKLKFSIPPYHIALCRLFMKFDGHLIKKGFKVAGSSQYEISKHNFQPEKINFPKSACVELGSVDYQSFRNFKQFRYMFNLDLQDEHDEDFIKYFWVYTQGHLGVASFIGQNPEKRDNEELQWPNPNGLGEIDD